MPNTTADEYDLSPPPPGSACSLREAIQTFNTFTDFGGCSHTGNFVDSDTIEVPAGHYTLTIVPAGGDDNSSGDLNPPNVTIQAATGATVTIDGNHMDRIFNAGGTLILDGLTLTNAFKNDPTPGVSFIGGAIFAGSGIPLTITNSTISGNTADGSGGGIDANGPTTLSNVTISGNSSTEQSGAGLAAAGTTLSLDHVTITDNHSQLASTGSSTTSGGLYNGTTTSATIHNSVIAGNTSASPDNPAPDCQGASITSQGGNVIGNATGCTFSSMASDVLNTSALLGPLADNGGTTFTHALLAGSPAIDRGVATCLPTDQRGITRPQGPACDSGAFELVPSATTPGTGPPPPPNPLCSSLRTRLKQAKKHHNRPRVRKLRKTLRKLGC